MSISYKTFFLFCAFQCFCWGSYSQCSSLTINSPSTSCKNGFFAVSTPIASVSYNWDFCAHDLTLAPNGDYLITSSMSQPYDIDVVKDGNNWFGFGVGYGSNTISRLDFGNNPGSSTPQEYNMGNPGGFLSRPTSIKIKRYDALWFGLIFSEANRSIVLLQFGSSLANAPIAEIIATNIGGVEGALDFEQTASNSFVVVVSNSSGNVALLTYTNGLAGGVTNTNNISVGGYLVDVEIINNCNSWSVFVLKYDTRTISRIDFITDFATLPSITTYSANLFPFGPYRLWMAKEGDYLNAIVTNISGGIANLDIGTDITNPSPVFTDFGNLGGVLTSSWSVCAIKNSDNWIGFTFNGATSELYSLSFPKLDCGVNIKSSTLQNPGLISYNSSGTKYPSLTVTYADGTVDSKTFPIQVQAEDASPLQISFDNYCLNSNVNFVAETSGSLINPSWIFGDGGSSFSQNPGHVYNTIGDYTVSLTGSVANGCQNTAQKNIKIYNPPASSFDLPIGLICTNNEFTFTNNTVDNFDGNLTYQWFVENNLEATIRDLKYSFLSSGNKGIKLKTSIPGCSNELTRTLLNVQTGPSVGFDLIGKCENELIQFTNSSAGDISGYLWDFGNGQASTALNGSQSYSSIGNYVVSLQTTGTNGCVSSTSKPITIYTQPKPDFSLDLPPFSCSGTPSQFNDLTLGPTDSNLSSWSWSFGDVENGISTVKNPTYTYALGGSYNVSLTTTTNFGCSATKLKTIQIAESPKSDFTLGSSCLGKPTLFVDASGANNKSWIWKIGGTSYAIQNPTHVFSTPGNFTSELMVTGNNGCISIVTKPIVVYVPPALDFLTENNCAPQTTLFKDVTAPNIDPIASHAWDFGGKGNGTGSSTQFSFSSPGTYNVKLTTTNQSGCSYSLTKSTIIVAAPNADFSSSNESGPPPFAVQFTNASKHATSYQWKFNDPNNSTSVVESPSFTYTTLGDFSVDLTAGNIQGCVDTKSKVIHVIVPSTDVELEQFTLLYDQATGSVRPVLSIKNNSNYTINSMDVILDIAGNALVKEKINITVLPNATSSQILKYELLPGNTKLDYLCVELQLTNDRLSDETDLTDNSECISLESNEIFLPPYPNPVQDQLHFDWIASVGGSAKVSIISQMGQLAYQKDVAGVEVGLNQIVLDVSKLNSGFYMLIFESAGTRKTFPFVILN